MAVAACCVALVVRPLWLQAQGSGGLQHQAWGTAEGLPQNSVHALAQTRDGFLWIATEAGLARFDGAQFRTYTHKDLGRPEGDDLCCLAVDSDGVLWIGSSYGIAALQNLQAVSLPVAQPFAQNAVHQLNVREGRVLAVTDAGSFLLRITGQAEKVSDILPGATGVSPTLRDRRGNVWRGSAAGLDVVSGSSPAPQEVAPLSHQSILALLEDAEGDMWVGSETTGLHRLRHPVFSTLEGSQGLPATTVAVAPDGVLIGTREGLLQSVTRGSTRRAVAQLHSSITALAVTGKATWAGTTDGLYRVDSNNTITRYTSANGLPDDYVRSLAAGADGDVWVGTPHGLARVSRDHVNALTKNDGLGSDLIGALLPARPAGVWVATEGGIDLVARSRVIQTIAVPSEIVVSMSLDSKGTLWFATQDGWLWQVLSGQPRKVLQLPSASERHAIESLLIDAHDTLWIVLRDGILSASLTRLRACTPTTCRSMTALVAGWGVADGMASAESLPGNLGHPALNDRGDVLFATRAGIAIADSLEAARLHPVPAIIEDAALEDSQLTARQLSSLPYGRTRLTFDFAGISLRDPSRVRYRVRLSGFDRDWAETGSRRTATYTALPPGSYHFDVQAALEGQAWPESATSLSFHIAPPFYRRWWFLTLAALSLAGLVLLLYRLRLRAEHRRFALIMAERNRLAREVHDTLAQDLVSTGIQLDVAIFSLAKQPHERTLELLQILRRRVAQGLAEARESIGELRDPDVRLDLVSRLHRMTERRSTSSLPIRFHSTGLIKPVKPGVEIELLRIASEAVANAVRHAHATHLTVQIAYGTEQLTITVVDDGRGFVPSDTEATTGHYGLQGMRERAEAIGGIFTIKTEPETGTTVHVSVRYPR